MTGAIVTLDGNLTADPELRYTQTGIPVASFTVAMTPRRLNRSTNQWEDAGDTVFLSCSAWRELGVNIAASLHKGAAVIGEGRLEPKSYENKEGQTVRVMECLVQVLAVDLRRQTVGSVMRITNAADPAAAWTPADDAAAAAPSTRRQTVAA